MEKGTIEIYRSEDGTEIKVSLNDDTVWMNAQQIGVLFGVQRPAIVKHVNNIYSTGELAKHSTCSILEQVAKDGKRRKINLYNLDVIISVGYRVNSLRATHFRQWATQRLKDYLVQGYAINHQRLAQTQHEVEFLRSGIQIVRRAIAEKASESGLPWLNFYAKGLELLDDYDHERLDGKGRSLRPAVYPTRRDYQRLIDEMKADFASAVFGVEKDQGFESAIHQIEKGFGDSDFYPSIEEKAAMLLYLVVKNHAFADGNKRIAAACFLLFLKENGLLYTDVGVPIISNEALAGLTLFIATSHPDEMETVRKLVVSILNRNQ